jgi:hypothetical protein
LRLGRVLRYEHLFQNRERKRPDADLHASSYG